MKTVGISIAIGVIGTTLLALAAMYTSSSVVQTVVRPFALAGFIFVNRHQGSLAFSLLLMCAVITLLASIVITIAKKLVGTG